MKFKTTVLLQILYWTFWYHGVHFYVVIFTRHKLLKMAQFLAHLICPHWQNNTPQFELAFIKLLHLSWYACWLWACTLHDTMTARNTAVQTYTAHMWSPIQLIGVIMTGWRSQLHSWTTSTEDSPVHCHKFNNDLGVQQPTLITLLHLKTSHTYLPLYIPLYMPDNMAERHFQSDARQVIRQVFMLCPWCCITVPFTRLMTLTTRRMCLVDPEKRQSWVIISM